MNLVYQLLNSRFILIIIFFFWMFPPSLNIFGIFNFNIYLISILIPSIFGILDYFSENKGSKLINHTFLSMIFGFILVLVYECIGIIYNIVDYSITKLYIMGFMSFFSAYFIVKSHRKIYGSDFIYFILRNLFFVGFLHSLLIILTAYFPSFAELLYQFVNITDKQQKFSLGDVLVKRYSGLLETGFSALSVTHALLLIAGIIFYWKHENKSSKVMTLGYLLAFFVMFVSILLIGRTGLIIFLIFLLAFLLLISLELIHKLTINKKIYNLFFFFSISFIASIFYFDFSIYEDQINSSFEIFINYINTGSFSSVSTDQLLKNELIFPDSIGLIFGTTNFGLGSSRIASDIGFVYLVNGVGILGTIFIFSPYYIPVIYAFKLRLANKTLFLFLLFISAILVPLNFKDLYFFGFGGHFQILSIIMFVYHFIYLDKFKENRNES